MHFISYIYYQLLNRFSPLCVNSAIQVIEFIVIIIIIIIIHRSICKDHDIEITDKWYEHEPETVMHDKDNNITIMWDMSAVNTDRTITANRPEIILKD